MPPARSSRADSAARSVEPARNDVIVVVHFAGRHYVVRDVDHASDWRTEAFALRHVAKSDSRWSKTREAALVLAHNIDNAVHARHGVREVFFGSKKRPRDDLDAVMDDDFDET